MSRPHLLRRRAAPRLESLEPRRLLADVSPPAFLQWFESSYDTVEERTTDIFDAGYGAVWLPPPGRSDSSDFSVGYDVYDRFDLGTPQRHTLYGTETGLKTLADTVHRAGIDLHIDAVINHNGFSDNGTFGFVESGGYPGFLLEDPDGGNDPFGIPGTNGDFHSPFDGGDLNERLAGLIDIDHGKNFRFIRSPVPGFGVSPGDHGGNLPAGTNTDGAGRLANVPDESNRRFYPDRDLDPIFLFDPTTGQGGIAVYPFNTDNPLAGDPVGENALGYQMRYLQWMVQHVGVDGFRVDAAKHFEHFVFDFLDRAVYRSNPRLLLDGSPKHVFSYSEVFDGNRGFLQSFIRKDINPFDPGRIGGNRDVLDFAQYFTLRDNLTGNGFANDWRDVVSAGMDFFDDGLHNGSSGVMFVNSHDDFGPNLSNVAHAYMLMHPGNAVVYMNGKEFGDNREFPKDGRGDALGGVFGDSLKRLVQIRNSHGRGNFIERWLEKELYAYERQSSSVVLLSNRMDSGFDSRTIEVDFAPGTKLIELTGNAANPHIDPFNDIPEVIEVFQDNGVNKVNVRFPRNTAADGDFHGSGYLVYGLGTPQAPAGLEITAGLNSILPGGNTTATGFANGINRLSDLHVIRDDQFTVRLQTQEVNHLGSIRDVFADGDNALLRVDSGLDTNGSGSVDVTDPADVSYAFEFFGDKANPLIGPGGLGGPRGDGEFIQTIDATQLEEGTHYLTARAYRHRTDGGPAVYSDFKKSVYVDRLPPDSTVDSFEPFTPGVNENRDLIIRSLDKTADNVHVFFNEPAATSDSFLIARAGQGQGSTSQLDRDLFVHGLFNVPHGNNVATIVTFERTGNVNVQRVAGLFTETIVGAGLGDLTLDGQFNVADVNSFGTVLRSNQTQFNPAADFTADGLVTYEDLIAFCDKLVQVGADSATLAAKDALLDEFFRAEDDAFAVINDSVLNGNPPGVTANDIVTGPGNAAFVTAETTTTAEGATAIIAANGSFSYDPTESAALQSLAAGETVTDQFTYHLNDGFGHTSIATVCIEVTGASATEVIARHFFYNDSAFDGGDPAASADDDNAIAPNKSALLPGQSASFSNYTSTVQGITGLMFDIAELADPSAIDATDFTFRMGNSHDIASWQTAPAPQAVAVREGDGESGSDRITLIWDPGQIRGTWLEVRVLTGSDTGLTSSDVSYFGNAPGETENLPGDASVDAGDFQGVRSNPSNFLHPAAIDNLFDMNRDGRVNSIDLTVVRDNLTNLGSVLKMISPVVPSAKQGIAAAVEEWERAHRNAKELDESQRDLIAAEWAATKDEGSWRESLLADYV